MPRRIRVLSIALLTISDSRTLATDPSGDRLQERLVNAGHQLCCRELCADDRYQVRATVSQWIADPTVDVVISSGEIYFNFKKASTPHSWIARLRLV